jgi:protein-tyrosine-phosphatase
MKYKNAVFVCSANMSRSPMAEAIFTDMARQDPELKSAGICAKSAATFSVDREKATGEAVQVMTEMGLHIDRHRAKHIDEKLIDWADVILVMEHQHKHYIADRFPEAKEKVYLLTEFVGEEGEIADPYCLGIEVYRECVNRLISLLKLVLQKMKS